ncbi:MAG: D-alanyl-D-alanine dipeptidase [Advenella sp.]
MGTTALSIITEQTHGVVIDLVYATPNNLAGKVVYQKAVCALHPDAEACLRKAANYARQAGMTLKIFDAFRPGKAQEIFWSVLSDAQYVSDPAQGSNHSRGVAVDVTLLNEQGQELDMGTGFDDMQEHSHHDRNDLPPEVQRNRLLLLGIMLHAGFISIPSEWWHYELPNSRAYPMIESDLVIV